MSKYGYEKDVISIGLLIGIMLILGLYTKSLLIISILICIVFIKGIYIYKNRLRNISKSNTNPVTIQNSIMDLITDIDIILKGLDTETMDDSCYKNLKYMSDKLNFYYQNTNSILNIERLDEIHKELLTIRKDIISIMNGEFIQIKNWDDSYNNNKFYSDEDIEKINKYLNILGLANNVRDINTIKLAYRTLSKKYHPDKNKSPEAKTIFEKIKNAYEGLRILLEIQ